MVAVWSCSLFIYVRARWGVTITLSSPCFLHPKEVVGSTMEVPGNVSPPSSRKEEDWLDQRQKDFLKQKLIKKWFHPSPWPSRDNSSLTSDPSSGLLYDGQALQWSILAFQVSFLEVCIQMMASAFCEDRKYNPQLLRVQMSSGAILALKTIFSSMQLKGKMSFVSLNKFFYITPSLSSTYTPWS